MPECEFLEDNCKIYLKDGLTCCFPTLNRFCLLGTKSNAGPTLYSNPREPTKTHFTRDKNLLCPLPLKHARTHAHLPPPLSIWASWHLEGNRWGPRPARSSQRQQWKCDVLSKSGLVAWPAAPGLRKDTWRWCAAARHNYRPICAPPIRTIPSVHTVHRLVPQTLTWGRLEQQSSSAWRFSF